VLRGGGSVILAGCHWLKRVQENVTHRPTLRYGHNMCAGGGRRKSPHRSGPVARATNLVLLRNAADFPMGVKLEFVEGCRGAALGVPVHLLDRVQRNYAEAIPRRVARGRDGSSALHRMENSVSMIRGRAAGNRRPEDQIGGNG
jgi:hypothetical protein